MLSASTNRYSIAVLFSLLTLTSLASQAQSPEAPLSAVVPENQKTDVPFLARNNWSARINNTDSNNGLLFVTIKNMGDHWEVEKFYDKLPEVLKASKMEVFAVTRNLSNWQNAHNDMVSDCRELKTKYYTVCSSSLADKKTGAAIVGIFFGGSGQILHGYVDDKVKEAINSIPPEQAQIKLSEFTTWKIAQSGVEVERADKLKEAKKLEFEKNKQLRAAAKVGTHDFCEQNVRYYDLAPGMPQGWQVLDTYKCFAFGEITLAMLKAEGWTITNRTGKVIGERMAQSTVYEINIEKVR